MLVGLNGFKGSGKDTVGQYLVDEYGFERLSFAAKLKDSAAALFGINPSIWEDLKNDKNAVVEIEVNKGVTEDEDIIASVTVRQFLQKYGTESHRDIFGQDFWVDYALKGIDPNKDYVFTDARFENELAKIKALGGYNARILRPSATSEDAHASEVAPPDILIDYVLDNSGDFENLYTQIDNFIKFLEIASYEEDYDESRLTNYS